MNREKIEQKLRFGLVIESEAITLTRNGYACVCPLTNRVALPVPQHIHGGGPQMQVIPPLCNSNCPAFKVDLPRDYTPTVEPEKIRFKCEATNIIELIAPQDVREIEETPGPKLVK